MSDIAARYARLASQFAAKVAAVPDERWSSPSPCDGWTALDVVAHVVETHGTFLALVGRESPEAPDARDDPVAAFDVVRRAVLADLQDPDRARETYEGPLGVKSFEWAIDRFQSFDLAVHGWDLARAAGLDEAMEPDEVERLMATAESWGDTARRSGVFGPAIEPSRDADPQTRLLAFLGRRS